jgi:hypothetical protein
VRCRGSDKEKQYHAGIDEGIFEICVAGQELLAEERGVLNGVVEGQIEWKGWGKVAEVDDLQHSVPDLVVRL